MNSVNWYRAWIISSRPKTLIAALAPILISWGYLLSQTQSPLDYFLLGSTWFACILLQIACNFTNDYYDYIKGTDDKNRIGPKRMLQQKIITPAQMKKAMWISYGLFFLLALYFTFTLSTFIFPLALISMLVAFSYTGGKYPLGYYGMGDIMAFLFFGPVLIMIIIFITGNGIVEFVWWDTFLLGLGPGFFSLTLLNINNFRDFEQDKEKKKYTMAIFFGKQLTKKLLIIYFFIALFFPISFVWIFNKTSFWYLLIFLIPFSLFVRGVIYYQGKKLNSLLGLSSITYLCHSLIVFWIWNGGSF